MVSMQKTAIFGWAFTPPTLWHKKVITELLDKKIVWKIILCPDGIRDDKDFDVTQTERKEMVLLFYADLVKSRYNVKLCLNFLADTSWKHTTTFDVNLFFESSLWISPYHIFGTDVIPGIPTWTGNPEHFIEKKLYKIFVSRPGHAFINEIWMENFEIAPIEWIEISSSQVREAIKKWKPYTDSVSKNIAQYIEANSLYTGTK